ncbi:MAG: glycoside hydrolase family 30 protein [Christensenellales bacterium]|jgi:glucosylceramidase
MRIRLFQTTKGKPFWQETDLPVRRSAGTRRYIELQPEKTYQPFLGLGTDINGCSCVNLLEMGQQRRNETLQLLFDREKGAGFTLLRDDIGSSDFTFARYALAEKPGDTELESWDFSREEEYLLPVLKEIYAIAPDTRLLGSPWSPPGWMKDTGRMVGPGGRLLPEYYPTYAEYLTRYILDMQAHGQLVDYITTQNEVRADHGGKYPMCQCLYTPDEERDFIKYHLIPSLDAAGLYTKVWLFDHNWNMAYYPDRILSDKELRPRIDGVAWHHYGGSPRVMTCMAEKYPGIRQYITEGQLAPFRRAPGSRGTSLARCLKCGAGSYIMWVMVLNEIGGPGEGPFMVARDPEDFRSFDVCLWNRKTQSVVVNETVGIMGQYSRYIERGALRIASTEFLDSVAFRNPDGKLVLVVENNRYPGERFDFSIRLHGHSVPASVPPFTVQTYLLEA